MDSAERTIEAALEVSKLLDELQIPHAMIGAAAMAVHGFARQTVDLDFASCVDPFSALQFAAAAMEKRGYAVEVITPDAEDPLGGLLNITRPGCDLIQLVNFLNPYRMGAAALVREAIANAVTLEDPVLAVVQIPYLICLKLYAGGPASRADIIALLDANPSTNMEDIAALCAQHNLDGEWRELQKFLNSSQ